MSGFRKRSLAAADSAFGSPDVGREVQRLAVQVGDLDVVVVDDPEPPDARPGEVHRHRRAERARADHQHAGVAQRDLRISVHSGSISWRL